MRNLFLICSLALPVLCSAQTKHVLLEEFTGAHCGICPNGAYYTDSMLQMHPDLIAVAVHTYSSYDAMVFPAVDTIGQTFALGAPLGAIDRICSSAPSTNTGVYINQWDNNITQRESQAPTLTVSIAPSWNSSTRLITANVNVNILTNLPTGDYRISLYVVEDSVVGTGAGYDQANSFDQQVGSQWFGLGDPIVGYVHRHVARALLPGAWGRAGVIPSSPTTGQTFSTTLTYTLPAGYNENRVTLVAFVNEVSGNHSGDEVLNAVQIELTGPTGIAAQTFFPYTMAMVSPDLIFIQATLINAGYSIIDIAGREIQNGTLANNGTTVIDLAGIPRGMYFVRIRTREEVWSRKLVLE